MYSSRKALPSSLCPSVRPSLSPPPLYFWLSLFLCLSVRLICLSTCLSLSHTHAASTHGKREHAQSQPQSMRGKGSRPTGDGHLEHGEERQAEVACRCVCACVCVCVCARARVRVRLRERTRAGARVCVRAAHGRVGGEQDNTGAPGKSRMRGRGRFLLGRCTGRYRNGTVSENTKKAPKGCQCQRAPKGCHKSPHLSRSVHSTHASPHTHPSPIPPTRTHARTNAHRRAQLQTYARRLAYTRERIKVALVLGREEADGHEVDGQLWAEKRPEQCDFGAKRAAWGVRAPKFHLSWAEKRPGRVRLWCQKGGMGRHKGAINLARAHQSSTCPGPRRGGRP